MPRKSRRVHMVDCACCGRHRQHEARRLCRLCYSVHRNAGTLHLYPTIPRQVRAGPDRRVRCARCGMLRQHYARRLCGSCAERCTTDGTIADWPRSTRPRAEMLADFDVLRSRGLPKDVIAERMGVTLDALNLCLKRARGTAAMDRQPNASDAYLSGLAEVEGPTEEEFAEADELFAALAEMDDTAVRRFRRWAAKVANGMQFRPDEFDALAPGGMRATGTPYVDAPIRDAVRSL